MWPSSSWLGSVDEALLVGWDALLVLDLGLDAADRVRRPDVQRGVVRGAAHSTALAASHRVINAQDADSKLRSYYTAALAQQVTEWARADLGAFGYAEWSPIMQMR